MQSDRYPDIHIRSKVELAKRITSKSLTTSEASELISDVLSNFSKYWRDHPRLSIPSEDKWVRNASYSKLGKLQRIINTTVLASYDHLLPNFLFGGITGKSHKAAVKHLLGRKRGRVLLKLDISRFYEQIKKERVEKFFALKAGCGREGAKLLANLCCVPFGEKENPADFETIARGFSTSSRLAVWCNLDAFLKLERLVKKELKGKDPRIAIYVDDIGITASRVTKEEMIDLYEKAREILEEDSGQKLPINIKKTLIVFHSGETYDISGEFLGKWGFEHLGLQMNRKTLSLGSKTRWKLSLIKSRLWRASGGQEAIKRTKKSLLSYKKHIETE